MKTTRTVLITASILASVGMLAPDSSAAQDRRIVVTPYVGVFVPAMKVAEVKSVSGGLTSVLGIQQQSALALGANASYWFNDLAGIEVGGAWAFSDATASLGLGTVVPGLGFTRNESARVIIGSAKLMLNLLPLSDRTALRLGVGPTIISRGGSAYESDTHGAFTGLTNVGGAISLCTRLPLTDFISLRVRAEDFLYSSKLRFRAANDPAEFTFGSKLQNDLVFSAGLQMVLWR